MKTAMILAAGRGERLRPLTDYIPKAMTKVKGKPLIEYHVERLAQAGFQHLVINHAHLGDQIRRYLGQGEHWNLKISYSPEPPGGLETGGGIVNALPLLGQEPFLTVNADIYTDFDFSQLSIQDEADAKLILVPSPPHNSKGDFGLEDQLLRRNHRAYTFAGIAVYRPEIFHDYCVSRFSVIQIIDRLISKNLVTGQIYNGLWIDIGNEERLALANGLMLGQGPT